MKVALNARFDVLSGNFNSKSGGGGGGGKCDTQGVSSRPLIATFTFLDSMAQISVFLNYHSIYPMELMGSRGGSKDP